MAKMSEKEKASRAEVRALSRARTLALDAEDQHKRSTRARGRWEAEGMYLTREQALAGEPCRSCGLPVIDGSNHERKGSMYWTPDEKAEYDAEDAAFRERHRDCRGVRWSMSGSRAQHCGECCPPPPMSEDQARRIASILNSVSVREADLVDLVPHPRLRARGARQRQPRQPPLPRKRGPRLPRVWGEEGRGLGHTSRGSVHSAPAGRATSHYPGSGAGGGAKRSGGPSRGLEIGRGSPQEADSIARRSLVPIGWQASGEASWIAGRPASPGPAVRPRSPPSAATRRRPLPTFCGHQRQRPVPGFPGTGL